jgi:hypothetical protein
MAAARHGALERKRRRLGRRLRDALVLTIATVSWRVPLLAEGCPVKAGRVSVRLASRSLMARSEMTDKRPESRTALAQSQGEQKRRRRRSALPLWTKSRCKSRPTARPSHRATGSTWSRHHLLISYQEREKQRDNDTDRYVLAAQSGRVAGAATEKPRARSPSSKTACRLRSPKKTPVPDHPTYARGRAFRPGFSAPTRGSGGVDFRILGMRKYARCSCNRQVAIWSRHADIDLCPRRLRS